MEKIFEQFCVSEGLPKPIAEYKFHPKRKWRIDYYFEHKNQKVALEVEGGVWTNGRHTRGKGFTKDMEKYNQLSAHGIFLIRCVPKKLLKSDTIKLIKSVLIKEEAIMCCGNCGKKQVGNAICIVCQSPLLSAVSDELPF